MKTRFFLNPIILGLVVLSIVIPLTGAMAQDENISDLELVEKYAPVLYFHPEEIFRPQPVEVLIDQARLRRQRRLWMDLNVLPRVSAPELFNYRDDGFFLDAWYGSSSSSDSKNYSAHRAYYYALLSPQAGGLPVVAYARVIRDPLNQHTTLQYWLFYYYNDWFNKHEGDWEMVQVMLNAEQEPEWVVLSQHHGGTRRAWQDALIEQESHPAVYVALGSHANFFWGDEIYPHRQQIGNLRLDVIDRTGMDGRVIPGLIMLPDPDELDRDPLAWPELAWLLFGGHWGETAEQKDFGGPLGPAFKGEQWQQPHSWGLNQPLDSEIWYDDRLQVIVTGAVAQEARVALSGVDGLPLNGADSTGERAILHTDMPQQTGILAALDIPLEQNYGVTVAIPNRATSELTRYVYSGLPPSKTGQVSLLLKLGQLPRFMIDGLELEILPDVVTPTAIEFETPDLVWVAAALSTSELVRGLLLVLAAAILPTLLYVGLIYWADRYEKEPSRLLATAFLWGAIPALLIATLVRIFYRLPPAALDRGLVESLWLVVISPLAEEGLKALVVIYIAWRYRREFDDVLDGLIYGAMVGFGFAMTGNILSYGGSFVTRGFAGLSTTILVEGVLFSLNHGFYSAIFGVGLGYARLSTNRIRRLVVPLGTFLLAVASHAWHTRLVQGAVALSPLIVVLTWLGALVILVIVAWSLRRQQLVLEAELADVLPEALYRTVSRPVARLRVEWQVLVSGGLRAWQTQRHLHQLCAEFAFKRMQARLFTGESRIAAEAETLKAEITSLLKED